MKRYVWILALALSAISIPAAHAQDKSLPSSQITVTGERAVDAKAQVKSITRAITRRPRVARPIARQYQQICVGVVGLSPEFASSLIERIYQNARSLDIAVAEDGCQVNTLVAFVRDPRIEVEKIRRQAPWLFDSLLDYEYERVLRGDSGARAWHATHVKGIDGKEFRVVSIGDDIKRDAWEGDPFLASHIGQQIRVDMVGSVVLIDSALAPGKTIKQLADYVSMRSFASVDDILDGAAISPPTILGLFSTEASAPDEMTDFDWAYLEGLYKLPRNSGGAAIHDATWAAYRKRLEGAVD